MNNDINARTVAQLTWSSRVCYAIGLICFTVWFFATVISGLSLLGSINGLWSFLVSVCGCLFSVGFVVASRAFQSIAEWIKSRPDD